MTALITRIFGAVAEALRHHQHAPSGASYVDDPTLAEGECLEVSWCACGQAVRQRAVARRAWMAVQPW